ncbi:MAG: AAA family ATPase [Nitrospinota bacterium]
MPQEKRKKELILFIGPQASGKTSFYLERFSLTHAHVSLDRFGRKKNKRHKEWNLIRENLAAGKPTVVDNTNPSRESRLRYFELARESGARVLGYFFAEGKEECLRRNRDRPEWERVPEVAIHSTFSKIEPPSLEEGFAELYEVRPLGSSFRVRRLGKASRS